MNGRTSLLLLLLLSSIASAYTLPAYANVLRNSTCPLAYPAFAEVRCRWNELYLDGELVPGSMGCDPAPLLSRFENVPRVNLKLIPPAYGKDGTIGYIPPDLVPLEDLVSLRSRAVAGLSERVSIFTGWAIFEDAPILLNRRGEVSGVCGKTLFSLDRVYRPVTPEIRLGGTCVRLINASAEEAAECCDDSHCGSRRCDPDTRTCTTSVDCDTDDGCFANRFRGCPYGSNLKTARCDLAIPWYPRNGTCVFECCEDVNCQTEAPNDSSPFDNEERARSTLGGCVTNFDCPGGNYCDLGFDRCVEARHCEPLILHPGSGRIDILLVGEGYARDEEFRQDARALIDYEGENRWGSGLLGWGPFALFGSFLNLYGILGPLSLEPLRSYRDHFNFWVIRPDDGLSDTGLNSEFEFLLRRAAAGCPQRDVAVLLSRKSFRSYALPDWWEAYVSVPRVEGCGVFSRCPGRLLAHELGHALFKLADEYTEKGRPDRPVYPNCAPDRATALQWWGDLLDQGAGMHEGCSYTEDNVRPHANSVMRQHRDLSATLGVVNERHARSAILHFDEFKTEYPRWALRVRLLLREDKLSLWGLHLDEVYPGPPYIAPWEEQENVHTAQLKDGNNSVLSERRFLVGFRRVFAQEEGPELPVSNEGVLEIFLPYYENATRVEILNRTNQTVLDIELARYRIPTPKPPGEYRPGKTASPAPPLPRQNHQSPLPLAIATVGAAGLAALYLWYGRRKHSRPKPA